jgi:KDO2-lipid IV(A) lauroyltransferase
LTDSPSNRPKSIRTKRSARSITARAVRTPLAYRAIAGLLRTGMRGIHRLGLPRALRVFTALVTRIGPFLPEHRVARRNLAAAFPEKSAAERDAILRGAWENFARVMVEFVFLDVVAAGFDPAYPEKGAITISGTEHFANLRDDGKPAIIVAAHLANWEVLGVVAHKYGLSTVLPFRAPANFHFAEDVIAQREALMGRLIRSERGAAFEIAAALERGDHLGMLVDQRLNRGVDVPFFGRPALTNPLPAKFAREYDCPVHGARAIRLPDGRLHLELTGPLILPRDGTGRIDEMQATVAINRLVEGWVREHPEQWFWLHDRWRHPRRKS